MAFFVHYSAVRLPIFFLLALPLAGFSLSLNRNAAHIEWRTAETTHFRFHYPKELEEAAGIVAAIAEEVAEDKIQRYRIKLPNKVEFTLRDDIFSNGWANALENTMNIWVTDWDFPVRSTHDWLRDVVTHEFSHLVSIQTGSKLPAYIQGLVFGYEDYYNEPNQGSIATIIPFTEQPNWFAEGVAQYESELSGFDAWDAHRDMLLRVAALEGKLLPIERMETFAGSSLEYEQGPYTQGFALVKFIAARYGDAAMLKLWDENSRLHRQTMSGCMQQVLRKTDREVYEEWKNSITARYAEQVKGLGRQVYGQKLTSKGFYNYYPRWDHKGEGIFFVSNAGRDNFRAGLRYFKLSDSAKKEEKRFTPIPGLRGYFDVANDDSTFVYSSSREKDDNGVSKLDIWQNKLQRKSPFFELKDPTEKRLTKNLNAVNASYSHDGSRVVFVRAEKANFRLCVAPVPAGKKLAEDEIKTIFPSDSMLAGRIGFNLYTPRFSPDGKHILFSYFNGESRNIGMVDDDGKNFVPLLSRPYDERDPEWAPDGKSLFLSSDSTGIYNLYRYTFETGSLQALTNVSGGAFSPAVDSSGTKLAYINYDKDGFSLYLLRGLDSAGLVATVPHVEKTVPKFESVEFEGKSQAYLPVPTRGILTPILYGQEMLARTRAARQGDAKWLIGASGYLNDPVLKNELNGALLVETGKGFDYFGAHDELLSPDKESQFYLGLSNHSTPVTLGANFFRGNLVTFDTVKTRSAVGTNDQDVYQKENYALIFRGVEGSAAYDLFDATSVGDAEKTSFIRLSGGYGWNDFNFYDLGGGSSFSFTYFKSLYTNLLLNLYGGDYDDKGMVAPKGAALAVSYSFSRNDLMRNGTFQETFDFSGGYPRVRYRTYDFHDVEAGLTYGAGLPWSKHGALVASGFLGSLLNWNLVRKDTARDTLDSFFEKGLFLRGYPYLRDIEHLAFSGENTATLSLDLNQPVWPDIYRRFWVVFVEDLYLDLFWEAGRAWNGPVWDAGLFSPTAWNPEKSPDGWFQTLGISLKVNAKIYHNYPFLMYFEAASGLSGIPDGNGGLQPLESIKIDLGNKILDTKATRIRFGVSFGLYNGLLGNKTPRHPMNPRSPFAAR